MSLQEWTLRESHRLTCVSQAEGGEEEDPQAGSQVGKDRGVPSIGEATQEMAVVVTFPLNWEIQEL